MISPDVVKLADRLPEIEKKLVEARAKNAKALADEERRHQEAKDRLALEDGSLSAEHAAAARAKKQIVDAIPGDLKRAADRAGSAYRVAIQEIKRPRDQRAAAFELLQEAKARKNPSAPPEEIEDLQKQAADADFALERAERDLKGLKTELEKAEAAVEAVYQKIRKEALAAKAERAARV